MISNPLLPFSQNMAKTAICFASDRNYLDFTLVAIQSIIAHTSPDYHYDIVILGTDCAGREEIFQPLLSNNVSIRILDMEAYIEKFGMRDFYVSGNIPMATYFRFFIPEIFAEYCKVLYLDGDILACDDVKLLLAEELGDALVGCMNDVAMFDISKKRQAYLENRLRVSPKHYFCAGVLLYNIKKCKEFDLSAKSMAKLHELVDPPFHDQDVLNSVTADRTKSLPMRWHFITEVLKPKELKKRESDPELLARIKKAADDPGIIHYAGAKPWNEDRLVLAERWWKTADSTPLGPALRLRLERRRSDTLAEAVSLMGRPWLFVTYAFYKAATLLAAGEKRKEYKRRAKLLKYIIRQNR